MHFTVDLLVLDYPEGAGYESRPHGIRIMSALQKTFLDTRTTAIGIDAPERMLRGWVETDRYWPGGKKPEGRYKFSPYDLCVLAVVRPLADLGVPVETAAQIAEATLKESSGFKASIKHAALDAPGAFRIGLADTILRVFKQNGEWKSNANREAETALPAIIQVRVGDVVSEALRRAGLLPELKGKP